MEATEEVNLIAAARFILRELESNKKLSNEAIKVLEDLGARLASMAKITETKDGKEEFSDIKLQINSIHDKVMILDSGTDEYKEYLKAVDEIRTLIGRLESLNPSENSEEHELLRKANGVLQTSMARIEEEFKHMLVHIRQNFEPADCAEDDGLDDSSTFSFVDDSADDSICRGSEVHILDLINPQIIPDLKTIASFMFDSKYNKECSEAFISVRKDALDDCLSILVAELTSIKNIMKMEWATLNSKIRKWTKALKVFVKVYLASEKFLCEQIFGENESITSFCFSESSKASIFQLLNFAEAVAVGPHQPEKLPRILDMYEVLVDVKPDIESFYPDDNGLYLRAEFHDVVTRLGDCVTSTFLEFKDAIESNASNGAFPRGGVHHLTRYVMNYITILIEYSNSLNYLLKDHGEDQDQDQDSSPMGWHFRSLMSILESNLKEKSRLYTEEALRHLFLMNNIQYMAEKVKGSELRSVLGDNWIRQCNSKVQQYAMSYERSIRPKSAQKEVTLCTDIGVLLNYDLVIQASGNFNTSNIIGNATFGATYKAEISPGVLVAIKRLRTGRFRGVQEFDAEIKILGRLRHPNLVTLIGYYASETEMFLIYNYLHGGNLERFIQERSMRAVDWRILFNIALDVARALAYLHDQCVPCVLHRDVKPSNILLDDDFNAYLSGFGLARLLGTSETHATTGVVGTFGYVAPEYAITGRVSDKADVYGYGVVLLELLSDKKVLDPSFSCYENGFNIVKWAVMMLKEGRAKEFFTAGLWDAGPHDDLVQVLYLAVVCTVDSFSKRPTMKQVVRRLKQLQPPSC